MPADSSIHTAVQRAADLVGCFVFRTPGGRCRIHSAPLSKVGLSEKNYRPAQALAVLAEQCMMPRSIGGLGLTPEELAERIDWSGPVPRRGISPYQEAVLERVAAGAGTGVPS
jgi:hypothetical protein